jgi:hypothetical protein
MLIFRLPGIRAQINFWQGLMIAGNKVWNARENDWGVISNCCRSAGLCSNRTAPLGIWVSTFS